MSVFQDPGFDDPTKWITESYEQGSVTIANSEASLYLEDIRSTPSYALIKQTISVPAGFKFTFNYSSYSPWNLDAAKVTLYIGQTVLWELPLQLSKNGQVEIDLSNYTGTHTITWKLIPLHFGVGLASDRFTLTGITEVWTTATHMLEIQAKPYPWYTPQGAVDQLITQINDINGAVLNWITPLTGWAYVGTTFSHDGTYVYLRIYLRDTTTAVQTMSPLTLGNVAAGVVVILFFAITVGYPTYKWLFGPVAAPTDAGLSNKDLGDAGDKYMKQQLADCELKVCIDPTLTQDQKALCIKNCNDSNLENWKGYQVNIFPDADHTPLDTGRAEVQKCYDTYNGSGKTTADYQTLLSCMQLKSNEAVTGDTNNTYNTYPPNAPAGVTAQEPAADCWIAGFVPGTCMLTAKTGKTIAIIGSVVVGGIILIRLFKK